MTKTRKNLSNEKLPRIKSAMVALPATEISKSKLAPATAHSRPNRSRSSRFLIFILRLAGGDEIGDEVGEQRARQGPESQRAPHFAGGDAEPGGGHPVEHAFPAPRRPFSRGAPARPPSGWAP